MFQEGGAALSSTDLPSRLFRMRTPKSAVELLLLLLLYNRPDELTCRGATRADKPLARFTCRSRAWL